MPDGLALFIGAAIIAFFSYDRFDRVTQEGARQLERVVTLLSPNKMRARRVVLRAYIFYALALLMIYFFLCAYAELLPLVGGPNLNADAIGASGIPVVSVETVSQLTTGFNVSEGASGQKLSVEANPVAQPANLGIDPAVSLTVALIIVGLAPSFPALQRVENWIRLTAHRLAGIPTWIIAASEDLSRNALGIVPAQGGTMPNDPLLIPQGAWERIVQYQIAAKGKLTAPDEFRHDIEIIFASASWILDRKLKLANSGGRRDFEALENSLRQRTGALVQNLDEKAGFRPGHTMPFTAVSDMEASEEGETSQKDDESPIELQRESWERLAGDAADLADDLHILLALYVEHEIITTEEADPVEKAGQKATARQSVLARKKLQEFLGTVLTDRTASGRLPLSTMSVWFWTIAVVLIVAFLWSMGPGRLETALQFGAAGNGYSRAVTYVWGVLNQYCIPMLVALMIRDSALQADRWSNIWSSHWTTGFPQSVFVIGVSWIVAALIIIGSGLWQAALAESWAANSARVWQTLQSTFEYNAPSAFRGAALAWIVVSLLDMPAARTDARQASSLRWAIGAAVIMALCGALTRYAMSLAALSYSPREALDQIDYGLITYAAIFAGIIGFAVIFCLSEAIKSAGLGNASRGNSQRRLQVHSDAVPRLGD